MYGFSIVVFGLDLDSPEQNAQIENLGYDALVSRSAGQTSIDVEIDAPTPHGAVLKALSDLAWMGVSAQRIDLDLVGVADIAMRTDLSRETVRLWTSGQRRQGFPVHFSTVGGSRVWSWSNVHAWLVHNRIAVDDLDPWTPLPLKVIEAFNGAFAQNRAKLDEGWLTLPVAARKSVQTRPQVVAKSGWRPVVA